MSQSNSMRKKYQKPEMRKVRLAPEEAVLAACKAAGALRSAGGKCDNGQGSCVNKNQGS